MRTVFHHFTFSADDQRKPFPETRHLPGVYPQDHDREAEYDFLFFRYNGKDPALLSVEIEFRPVNDNQQFKVRIPFMEYRRLFVPENGLYLFYFQGLNLFGGGRHPLTIRVSDSGGPSEIQLYCRATISH
jgi:hypothetical protein